MSSLPVSMLCTVFHDISLISRPVITVQGVFLDKIQTEILRVFLLAIHRHLYLLTVLPTIGFLGLEISTA
jgi:hypothetical protein